MKCCNQFAFICLLSLVKKKRELREEMWKTSEKREVTS